MIFFQRKDGEGGISDELYHRHFHDGKRVWNNFGHALDFGGNTEPDYYGTTRDKICAENNPYVSLAEDEESNQCELWSWKSLENSEIFLKPDSHILKKWKIKISEPK